MFKRMFIHKDHTILCATLTSAIKSQIAFNVPYRFMDMTFLRPDSKNKDFFMLKVDEDPTRVFQFRSKSELSDFVENRTKQLMKELQDKEDPNVVIGDEMEDIKLNLGE